MEIMESLNWGWRRPLTLIRQTESAECGVACLAMIADWHGYRISLPTLRGQCNVSQHGMAFSQLIECAEMLNLSGRAVKLELDELGQLATPCVLHWDLNHFVVLKRIRGKKIEIHDPAKGALTLTLSEVNKHFTGIALELTPNHEFEKKDERQKIRLSQLMGKTIGLKPALGRIFVYTLVLEVLTLLSPILNQLVIDEVLVGYDDSLLVLVIIAMLLITSTQTLIGLAKDWTTITLAVNFNMQWTANVFHHLFRLPIDWFEKRAIGNISAKFAAVNTIQETLTTSIIQALLDIVLVVSTLVVMFIYSIKLSLIGIGAGIIYATMRFLWFDAFRKAEEDIWIANTAEESHFLESIRGVLSLRINGALSWRESAWRNLNVSRRNAQLHENKLAMVYGVINTLITSLVSAAVLWFGANLVISGQFSIGMLVAFMSFQGRFSGSISSLVDKFFEYRMLDVYNERLADIVLTPRESSSKQMSLDSRHDYMLSPISQDVTLYNKKAATSKALELRGVAFSYAEGEPEILKNVSFCIESGEIVALVGASGGGKTTVAKLLLGLYKPNKGEIVFFDKDCSSLQHTRNLIGSVLQEDKLFSGSILDNITFFSDDVDNERAVYCAKLAAIHDDVEALNMGYQTLIGEMGGTLSGGQKQRLLLARALYKQPRFLILDEATSNLDIYKEAEINMMLRQLGLPVLLIAHRPETIASADRILLLEGGVITELQKANQE
ncbi:peptidase domain-containing ABC transporter [Photobacterium frigidiphilum]|uniref:peptidase domain-containing ABC transporter n=1 Tax=Photobacterium frigidiphilum TaxID=264736 RepID=UPI003D0F4DC5